MKKKSNGKLFTVPVTIGILILILVLFGVILGPLLISTDPNAVDMGNILQPPGKEHWLGTDSVGRDQFTRLLYGGRTTLLNALLAVAISVVVGVPLGLICGYYGGLIDTIIMRIWDCILAFPALLLAFIMVAALGRSSYNAVFALSLIHISEPTRH